MDGFGGTYPVPQTALTVRGVQVNVPQGMFMGGISSYIRGLFQRLCQLTKVWGRMSVLEKAAALASAIVVVRTIYRYFPVELAKKLVYAVIPGLRQLRNLITGKPEVVLDPEVVGTLKTVLESRRQGSEESEMTFPKCQARVGVMRDGQFVVLGSCIRFGDHIVGPDHVLGGEFDRFAYGRQSYISLYGLDRIVLGTDLVAIPLSARDMSTLGLSCCTLALVPDCGAYAQVVGPMGKGTTGNLRNDVRCFGRVVYDGTTLAGYSGSAYTIGTQVAGIHQSGGPVNGGFSASFVWARLKAALRQKPEASEDWLLGQMDAGKVIRWDPSSGDPDEVTISVGGRYSVIERSSMVKAFGKDWDSRLELVPKKRASYESAELTDVSGETPNSQLPGVSSSSQNSQDSARLLLLSTIDAYKKLSSEHRRKFRKSCKLSGIVETTSTQESEQDA
uniref:Uncharacterized protein n=1 Tax=Riboviria sp. TaxID=2585031 RepID=A0A8K1WSP1_9VIRU|nr:MAG: hypothetical protein 1 [Riboviria sp.]